jgi:3-ketosteroid 9alpha-monooxygenase subunit A
MATSKEYGLGEFDFPRGWFMVADAEEVTDKPKAVRYFGRDLVLYRGQSGRPVMLDAYCPHMGTHLASNETSYVVRDHAQVEGDSIRCPYHAWRFGPDGKCDQIPYFSGPIPPSAKVRSWLVKESFGCVFAWHDPEEGEPDFDLPAVNEWDDPAWVRWKLDHLGVLACHPQEVLDNMADVAHLGPVHGSVVEYFDNEFDGVICRQKQGGGHRTLVSDNAAMLETDTWYTGPGILMSRMTGLADSLMLIAHTPVDDGVIKVWHGLLVKAQNAVVGEADIAMARAYQAASCAAFAQDFDVWANKRPCFQVLQLPTDGPFGKVRIWYRQFYNPRARAGDVHKQVNGVHTVRGMPPHPARAVA